MGRPRKDGTPARSFFRDRTPVPGATEPVEPPTPQVRLVPCPKCSLRLSEAPTSRGVADHDCREVQRLRKLDATRKTSAPLEQLAREALVEMLPTLAPKDLAAVVVTLEKAKAAGKGTTGPSEALKAILVN